MQITGITVSRALTALTFTPLADKSPSVTLVHPGSGPGAVVTFFDTSTGTEVGSVSVGPSRPVKTSLIGCGTSLTLSYQVSVQDAGTIPSPGLTINLSTSAEEDEIIGAIFDGTTVSADGTQIILPKPLSSSSTAKTAPLATILATVPAVGTVAQPTDYPDGRLAVVAGPKWGGYVGTFPDLATLNAVTKTNIATSAEARVTGVGLYVFDGTNWGAMFARDASNNLVASGNIIAANQDLRKASFKIPPDTTFPNVETLAANIFAPDQAPSCTIPAGFFSVNSVRQATLTLRIGQASRFPTSGLQLWVRSNSSANGAGLDGTIVGRCVIDLTQCQNAASNTNQDVTVVLWIGTRPAGTPTAVPFRSHMNWQIQSLLFNSTQGATYQQGSGAGGYEVSSQTLDGTIDNTLYLSYRWESPVPALCVANFPTDGNEWLFGGRYQINRSMNGSLSCLIPDNPSCSTGQYIQHIDCSPSTAIAVGTNGTIRKGSNGGQQRWSARLSTQTTGLWRSVFYASWLGTRGRWIVVGDSGSIATSDDDGDTWTSRSSGGTDMLLCVFGSVASGLHVCVNVSGKRLTSADGITWATFTDRTALSNLVKGKAYGLNVVITGQNGKIAYSSDGGSTWTDKTSGLGSTTHGFVDYDPVLAKWVLLPAAGSAGYYATTPGGTWTAITGLATTGVIVGLKSNGYGVFAAIDSVNVVWRSTDGIAFADQTTTPNGSGYLWGDFGEFRC